MSHPEESLDERRARLEHNEVLFRSVNDRMQELNEAFASLTGHTFEIVCECGDLECVQLIPIPRVEYARVRTDAMLFVLVPGHENAIVDAVVEDDRATAYLIVRKHSQVPTGPAGEAREP